MKLWYYLVIMTGIMIFFSLAGLPSGTGELNNLMGISYGANQTIQNVTVSSGGFYNEILGGTGMLVALVVSAGALAVGFITKTSPLEIATIPFVTLLAVKWIQTFIGIMNYAVGTGSVLVSSIIVLIFLPLTIGFVASCVEWVKGTD